VRFEKQRILAWILLLLAPVCTQASQPAAGKELRVLFIGNSFTFSNDLPAIIEALAASRKHRLTYESITFPNLSLEDQWNRGEAQQAIARGKWDVVVLQQGPSSLEESRRLLLEYTRRFSNLIRAAGAKPALYMVWPSRQRFADFDRVVESYALAAREVDGSLLPVGQAWRAAWKRDATLPLYDRDNFHPSVAGSYLAALVIYQKLFGDSPIGLPARLKLRSKILKSVDLPVQQAKLLQQAAAEANRNF
jgi:hypothetical protein